MGGGLRHREGRHQVEKPVALKQLVPEISDDIADVVVELMEKDPSRRIQTAGEVAIRLRKLTEYTGSRISIADDAFRDRLHTRRLYDSLDVAVAR